MKTTSWAVLAAAVLGLSTPNVARAELSFQSARDEGPRRCKNRYPADGRYAVAKFNLLKPGCWSCPAGYSRTLVPKPDAAKACKKPFPMRRAQPVGRPTGLMKVCKGAPWKAKGRCWTCPDGYRRSLKSDRGHPLCKPKAKPRFRPAVRRGDAGCKKGQWAPALSKKCFSCPAGYVRNPARLTRNRAGDPKACMKLAPSRAFQRKFLDKFSAPARRVLAANPKLLELAGRFAANLAKRGTKNNRAKGLRALSKQDFLDAGGGEMLQEACSKKLCTVTITAGGDGSYFAGANVSGGIAFGTAWEGPNSQDGNDLIDKDKDLATAGVLTANLSAGTSVGGDAGINISFWKAPYNQLKGFGHGIVVAGSYAQYGGNASVWWSINFAWEDDDWRWYDWDLGDDQDEFAGFSIGYQGGLSAELEYNWGYTWNWGDSHDG